MAIINRRSYIESQVSRFKRPVAEEKVYPWYVFIAIALVFLLVII